MERLLLIVLLISVSTTSTYAASLPLEDNLDRYTQYSDMLVTNGGKWDYTDNHFSYVTDGCAGGSGGCVKVSYDGEAYYPSGFYLPDVPEIYISFKMKSEANTQSVPEGGIKFVKAFGNGFSASDPYANFTVNYGGTPADEASLTAWCYGESDTGSNDTGVCLYPNGESHGTDQLTWVENTGELWYATQGTWHTVEIYAKHSTGYDPVNFDGEFKLTIDGVVIMNATNLKNRGALNAIGWERLSFGDYSNVNADMTVWFDDIYISNVSLSTPNLLPSTVEPPSLLIIQPDE